MELIPLNTHQAILDENLPLNKNYHTTFKLNFSKEKLSLKVYSLDEQLLKNLHVNNNIHDNAAYLQKIIGNKVLIFSEGSRNEHGNYCRNLSIINLDTEQCQDFILP